LLAQTGPPRQGTTRMQGGHLDRPEWSIHVYLTNFIETMSTPSAVFADGGQRWRSQAFT